MEANTALVLGILIVLVAFAAPHIIVYFGVKAERRRQKQKIYDTLKIHGRNDDVE